LSTSDNVTWTLGNLGGLTGVEGQYALVLTAQGSGIKKASGDDLQFDASEAWVADFTAPAASIQEVSPAGRTSLDQLAITLSEPLAGFGVANLSLTRNGAPVDLLSASARLTSSDQQHWSLRLRDVGGAEGDYVLTVIGGSLTDAAGNSLV